jgi:hypothetical protein
MTNKLVPLEYSAPIFAVKITFLSVHNNTQHTTTHNNTTLTRDRLICHRRDSNPQSQQASGRRPTPLTARPLGSATDQYTKINLIKRKLITYIGDLELPISRHRRT